MLKALASLRSDCSRSIGTVFTITGIRTQAVRHQQHRVLVAQIQDRDLAERPRIPPQLHRLVEGPRMAVAPADMVQFDPAPLRGGRGAHGLDQLRRTPPQGQETDAELVELGQNRPGGQGAVEDQFLGIGPRPLPAEVREPERRFGAGLFAHGGFGVAEDPGVDAAGEEGEDALLAAAALGNIVLLDQGVVPMVGNGVEIEVEGGAPRQGRLAEGLGPAALERGEAARIDAAGVFGEGRALGKGVEGGEEGEALVEDLGHGVGRAAEAPEFEREQGEAG